MGGKNNAAMVEHASAISAVPVDRRKRNNQTLICNCTTGKAEESPLLIFSSFLLFANCKILDLKAALKKDKHTLRVTCMSGGWPVERKQTIDAILWITALFGQLVVMLARVAMQRCNEAPLPSITHVR